MRPSRGLIMTTALVAVLTAPAACGRTGPGGGGGSSPTPSLSAVSPSATPTSAVPSSSPAPSTPPTTAGSGSVIISSRVAYQWNWPNDANRPGSATHQYAVPPVPQLVRIGAGDHPREPGERPYNRMTFTFTTAMPSYTVRFVDRLVADGSGTPIALRGNGVLQVTFRTAQAHKDGGTGTIRSRPPADLGMTRMVDYAAAGDYEGVVTYGIGIAWPVAHSNPQIAVRVYEVVRSDGQGGRQHVVAVDVDAR